MKSSTIIWIVVIVLVILGLVFWISPSSTDVNSNVASSTRVMSSTTVESIPGDNLTLGPSSNSTVGDYLVGYNGMTVYTYSPDTVGVSNCSGQCAANWPPYIVTSTNNLVAESPAAGKISTLVRADGSIQVTYNGHPLYFYIKDKVPGDVTGQGVGGVWYVMKP